MKTNPKRVPYSDKVKARVREMREMGYSNVQITEATSVPGSTIARWAAEGKWRVKDLVEEPEFLAPVAGPDGVYAREVDLGGLGEESEVSARTGGSPSAQASSAQPGRVVGGSTQATAQAERDQGLPGNEREQKNQEQHTQNQQSLSRQQQLEDALEKAAVAAEDAILRGNFAAAGKATQMADTLSRALERVRKSAPEEKREGVFYTAEDIARAREELTRRFDRLARTLRKDEMSPLQR